VSIAVRRLSPCPALVCYLIRPVFFLGGRISWSIFHHGLFSTATSICEAQVVGASIGQALPSRGLRRRSAPLLVHTPP